ncbi:hypothetical protein FGD77_11310 [Roseovarius sp. M141]|nr:hypothetical protein [Roseovarius sp. M141]
MQCDGRIAFRVWEVSNSGADLAVGAVSCKGGNIAHATAVEYDQFVAHSTEWPLNNQLILIDNSGKVSIRAGGWGSAPVYLAPHATTLYADWDPARLYGHISGEIDPVRAALALAGFGHPYSRHTLFRGLFLLTERSHATFDPETGRLDIKYPASAKRVLPRRLRPDADVTNAFESVLVSSLRRFLDTTSTACVQVSGGLDSAVIATALSRIPGVRVTGCGILVPGPSGVAQIRRRDEILTRAGADDFQFKGIDHPPFSGDRLSAGDAVPWEEYYREPMSLLMAGARARGFDRMFTGFGGDEISTLSAAEISDENLNESALRNPPPPFLTPMGREALVDGVRTLDIAPPAVVERSCLECAQTGAVGYLRSGIWPLNPYFTPELVQFCRSLPVEWRRGRTLQRRYLTERGLSTCVTRRHRKETFYDILRKGLKGTSAPAIVKVLATSRLAEAGLVDRDRLVDCYAVYRQDNNCAYEGHLLNALMLELSLRSVEMARAKAK